MTATPGVVVDVCSTTELAAAGKLVREVHGVEVLLVWSEGAPAALNNVCIHRERRLSEGTIFNGRAVCPGHQWSFDLATGYCKERDRYQPSYSARVVDGDRVVIHLVDGDD